MPYNINNALGKGFEYIKVRHLAMWMIGIMLLFIICTHKRISKPATTELLGLIFYMVVLIWILVSFRRNKIDLNTIAGKIQKSTPLWQHFAIMISLFLLAAGFAGLLEYTISFIKPDTVLKHINQKIHFFYDRKDSEYYLVLNVLKVTTAVLIAPIVEELTFRGFILNRFSYKWGITTAIIVSSAIFSILHGFNVFGSFVFAMVMCLSYIKAGSIRVNIMYHISNNALVFILVLLAFFITKGHAAKSLSELRVFPINSLVLVFISSPFLGWWLYKNWPQKEQAISTP